MMSSFDDVELDQDCEWNLVPHDLYEALLECLRRDMLWLVEEYEGRFGPLPEVTDE